MPCYCSICDKLLQIQFQVENIEDTRKSWMILNYGVSLTLEWI